MSFPADAARKMMIYGAPSIAFVGFLGNFASLAVMVSPRMRKRIISVYLAVLALADSQALLSIVTLAHTNVPLNANGTDYNQTFNYCCLNSWRAFSMFLPAWVIVCVSVERFIVTWYPLLARDICTRRTACIAMATVTLLAVLLSVTTPLLSYVISGSCDQIPTWWLLFSLYAFLPFLLLLVLNSATAVHLLCKEPVPTSIPACVLHNNRKATMAMLAVMVAYLLFTTLGSVYFPIRRAFQQSHTHQTYPDDIIFSLSQLGLIVNYSCHLFVYVFAFEKFRNAFIHLLRRMACSSSPLNNRGRYGSDASMAGAGGRPENIELQPRGGRQPGGRGGV